jgi:hypothetical protein
MKAVSARSSLISHLESNIGFRELYLNNSGGPVFISLNFSHLHPQFNRMHNSDSMQTCSFLMCILFTMSLLTWLSTSDICLRTQQRGCVLFVMENLK